MDGHCLRSIFDAARCSQATMRTQRIIAAAMAGRDTAQAVAVPADNAVEKAHAALMRDTGSYPVAI
jgi:hypothetical protein